MKQMIMGIAGGLLLGAGCAGDWADVPRPAPRPPALGVCQWAWRATRGWASATAMASPARSRMGRSMTSSPTKAASSAVRPSLPSSSSKAASLSCCPW